MTFESTRDLVVTDSLILDETPAQLAEVIVKGENSWNCWKTVTGSVQIAHGESFSTGRSSAGDWQQQRRDRAREFRKEFERILCEDGNLEAIQTFMAKNQEHPHFAWQDVLLSIRPIPNVNQCDSRDPVNNDRICKTNDSKLLHLSFLLLSYLIEYFADVLQRELFHDGVHLMSPEKNTGDRYGALHAAVRCGRTEIVWLVCDHDRSRNLVWKSISHSLMDFVDDKGDIWDHRRRDHHFESLRRAVLWKHMSNLRKFGRVSAFMKKFDLARHLANAALLTSLIDETVLEIDHAINEKDTSHPWIAVLAWASAARQGHITTQFKSLQPHLFAKLLAILEDCRSPVLYFLLEARDETIEYNTLDYGEQQQSREKLRKLLYEVMKTDSGGSSQDYHGVLMQLCSVHRLSERTPNCRWTALHLAAALGDHDMVGALIDSYDSALLPPRDGILAHLGELGLQEQYRSSIALVPQTFHDAFGMTPLHYAVAGNHKLVVEKLMKWKIFRPHVNDFDVFMRTPFQIACSKMKRASIVQELLLNSEVDVNTKDCCSFTPLHWAVFTKATETVRILVLEAEKQTRAIHATDKNAEGHHPYRTAEDLDPENKKVIQELLLRIPEVKDGVERMYRDRQVYVDAANAILVGAALIASVTFGGWLQPPLGNHKRNEETVRVFWGFSSLSFFFAVATVMAGAGAVLPVGDLYIEDAVESIRTWLMVTSFMLILSVAFVLGAFAAAGFASLSSTSLPHLRCNMIITTTIGSVVCGTLGLLFCYRLFRIPPDRLNKKFNEFLVWLNKGILNRGEIAIAYLLYFPLRIRTLLWRSCNAPTGVTLAEPRSDSLQIVLQSVPRVLHRVTQDELRKHWREQPDVHVGNQICRIRSCYRELESLRTLEELYESMEISLQEYTRMWSRISKNRALSNLLIRSSDVNLACIMRRKLFGAPEQRTDEIGVENIDMGKSDSD